MQKEKGLTYIPVVYLQYIENTLLILSVSLHKTLNLHT